MHGGNGPAHHPHETDTCPDPASTLPLVPCTLPAQSGAPQFPFPGCRRPPSAKYGCAGLRVLEPEFCTSNDTGRIMAMVLGMVAEMERRFILERQRAGIDVAKKKGVYKGRKPSVPVEEVRKMHGDGKGPAEIAEALGVSRMSVWRALNAGVA